jgi:hypothetical protein
VSIPWQAKEDDEPKLDAFFRNRAAPSPCPVKASYIVKELEETSKAISDLETAKHQRLQFLMALTIAYAGFLVAPYKVLANITPQAAVFYALAGVWLSVVCLAMSDRYLDFVGSALRQKATLFAAINSNRAYLFANDSHYYDRSVFPLGVAYDSSRAWSYSTEARQRSQELYPGRARSSLYPTLLVNFVQIGFVAGFYHCISILMQVADRQEIVQAGGLAWFRWGYYSAAFAIFFAIALLWIHFIGNTCLHYHQARWEAHRIRPQRPNPRATGEAWRKSKYNRWVVRPLVGIAWLGVSAPLFSIAAAAWAKKALVNTPLSIYYLGNWLAATLVLLFLALKYLYVKASLECERDSDKRIIPVRAKRKGGSK